MDESRELAVGTTVYRAHFAGLDAGFVVEATRIVSIGPDRVELGESKLERGRDTVFTRERFRETFAATEAESLAMLKDRLRRERDSNRKMLAALTDRDAELGEAIDRLQAYRGEE